MTESNSNDNYVQCSLFGETFNLRCLPEQRNNLLQAVNALQTKSSKMMRENPNLTPSQAAILVALDSETSLIEYLNSETPFINQATKYILQMKDSLKRAEND